MVHDFIVTLPNTPAIRIVRFQGSNFLFNGRVFNVLQTFPNIEAPAIRVVDVMLAGRVQAIRLDWTINKATSSSAFRGIFGSELEVAAKAGHRTRRCAALHPGNKVKIVATFGH